MVLDMLLTQSGFDVVPVENGHEAFLMIKQSFANLELLFELIILDINMPICNGNDACK